jgi:glucosyl-dolichyl phosphate glucuronosyltransferase
MNFSIVLCTYNRCESLRKVLSDLNRLGMPEGADCEVIVVDNNSNDETRAVVEAVRKESPEFFKYVFESRQGKSFALNNGISHAQGDVIAFTDDDVFVDSEWLTEIKRAFDSYDCIGICGKIVPVWNSEKPRWFEEDGCYGLYAAIVKMDLGNEAVELKSPAFGANMAFRRSAFEKYGPFRTDLGPNPENLIRGEDSDFSWRLIRGGEKLMYAPRAVVYHPVEQQRIKKAYFQRWYFDYGRSVVRTRPISDKATCYRGVPKYLIRIILEQMARWLLSLNPRRRFYYKLQAYQTAGEIAESYAIKNYHYDQ